MKEPEMSLLERICSILFGVLFLVGAVSLIAMYAVVPVLCVYLMNTQYSTLGRIGFGVWSVFTLCALASFILAYLVQEPEKDESAQGSESADGGGLSRNGAEKL